MFRLLELGRPHQRTLLAAFLCMAVLGVTTGAYAFLLGPALRFVLSGGAYGAEAVARWVPWVSGQSTATLAVALPLAVVAIGLVRGLSYLGQFYFVGLYGQRVVVDLRRRIFERLLGLSPLQLSLKHTGDLLSRFTADVAAVETAATYTVASWLRDSLQIVVLVAVCLSQSWQLSLLAFGMLPLAVLPAARLTRSLLMRVRESQATLGGLAAQVHENLGALRTLQAFGAGPAEVRRFDVQGASLSRSLERAGWTRAAVPALMEVLAASGVALALGAAAHWRLLAPEALVSFLAALILLYQPAKDLGRVSQFGVAAAAALERIGALLDEPVTSADVGGARVLAPVQTAVRLEGVHFAWGGRAALDGVDLELPVGRTTALVGPSGGGKSTVVAALLKFEPLRSGRVTFDGVDGAGCTAASVRAQFGLVTQEPLLFSQSVLDNLRVARPSASREELEAAARTAQAHDFIQALPRGYDTLIGERGVNLSGGQRQRLCLARALLKGAPVLVLDEATSSLDTEAEAYVQAALEGALAGRTALVIAHRLSTVASADRICVLEAGRVVEQGSHRELLARGGAYARLWSLQSGAVVSAD